jgi:hypothetical protein
MASVVTRDGQAVSPVLEDEDAAFVWLLKHQPMSTDWAIKYEGYAIVDAAELAAQDTPEEPGREDHPPTWPGYIDNRRRD